MNALTSKQLSLIHNCMREIAKLNNVPIQGEEALEWLKFENASLDEVLFGFSVAISIDYPNINQEQNGQIALQCVADLLATLVDESKKPEVFHEDPISPSTLFCNWVRIGQEITELRESSRESSNTRGSDGWKRSAIMGNGSGKH